MNNTSEKILDSISLLIDNAVNGLAFDKTIKAEIYSVANVLIGEYKVKYEGAIFSAFVNDLSVKYNIGDIVFVKIPRGDMSDRKTIEGKVKDNENIYKDMPILDKYVSAGVGLDRLLEMPVNQGALIAGLKDSQSIDSAFPFDVLVDVTQEIFSLKRLYVLNQSNQKYELATSYTQGITYYLFNVKQIGLLTEEDYIPNKYLKFDGQNYSLSTGDWDSETIYYLESEMVTSVQLYTSNNGPQALFNQYSQQHDVFKVSAQFKTDLRERHTKGTYGLIFEFFTSDNSTVSYTFDCKDFVGDPYNYNVWATQQLILPQKSSGYLTGIKNIYFYQRDFEQEPARNNTAWENLWVRNVNLEFVKELDQEYLLDIIAPNGYQFTDDYSKIILQGRLLYHNENIYDSRNCSCQWYKQDLSVTINNTENLDRNAGYGWSRIEGANTDTLTIPASYKYSYQQTADQIKDEKVIATRLVYSYNKALYAKIDDKTYYKVKNNVVSNDSGDKLDENNISKLVAKMVSGTTDLDKPSYKAKYKLAMKYKDDTVFTVETPYIIDTNADTPWFLKQYTDIDNGVCLEVSHQDPLSEIETEKPNDVYQYQWYEDEGKGLIQPIYGASSRTLNTTSYYKQGTSETFYCKIYTKSNGKEEVVQILQHTITPINAEEAVTVNFEGQDVFRYDAKGNTPYDDTERVRVITPIVTWADGLGNAYSLKWLMNGIEIEDQNHFSTVNDQGETIHYPIYYYLNSGKYCYYAKITNEDSAIYYEIEKKNDIYNYKINPNSEAGADLRIQLTDNERIKALQEVPSGRDEDSPYHPPLSMIERVWIDAHQKAHFRIREKYNNTYNNNTLTLQLTTIDNKVFNFNKEIIFVKDGDPGVNGTSYTAIIRPVDQNNNILNGVQLLTKTTSLRLKAFVYKDGEPRDSDQFTIDWDVKGYDGNEDDLTVESIDVYKGLTYYFANATICNQNIDESLFNEHKIQTSPLSGRYDTTTQTYYCYYNNEQIISGKKKSGTNNTIIWNNANVVQNVDQSYYCEYNPRANDCLWRFRIPKDFINNTELVVLDAVPIYYKYDANKTTGQESDINNIYGRWGVYLTKRFNEKNYITLQALPNTRIVPRFVKAKISIDNTTLHPIYPIDYTFQDGIDSAKIETNVPTTIKYSSSGHNPVTYSDAVYALYDGDKVQNNAFVSKNSYIQIEAKENEYYIKPIDKLIAREPMGLIQCNLPEGKIFYRTILMFLDTYGNEFLNDWDGTTLDVDGENNYILAPMIGAGIKSEGNTFTGIVMGEYHYGNANEVGLFGFNQGKQSFSLDRNGKATFGIKEMGYMIFAPRETKPIQVINKNNDAVFYVTSDGDAYFEGEIETGSGHIGGWSITDTTVTNGNTTLSNVAGITTNSLTLQTTIKDSATGKNQKMIYGAISVNSSSNGDDETTNLMIHTLNTNNSIILESSYNVVMRTSFTNGSVVLGSGWTLGSGVGSLRCTIPANKQEGIYARFAPDDTSTTENPSFTITWNDKIVELNLGDLDSYNNDLAAYLNEKEGSLSGVNISTYYKIYIKWKNATSTPTEYAGNYVYVVPDEGANYWTRYA